VQDYLHQHRAQTFEKAARKLARINPAVLYTHLKEWLSTSAGTAPPASGPMAASEAAEPGSFPNCLAQNLGRFWQAFETQVAQSQQDPRTTTLHGARIASKRLRYLTEVVQAFDVQGSSELVAWLRSIQQQLGDWHDREVLERMMIAMVARPEFLQNRLEVAIAVENLILRNRAAKKKFAEKYFEMTRGPGEFERAREWMWLTCSRLLLLPSQAQACKT
jgi:CHAD domain-containing protein